MKHKTVNLRKEFEFPESIEKWGWKYHHIGIPTEKKMPGEKYIPKYKFYVSGFEISPFGIEWMRFEADSPFDDLIKTVPHLAFVVEDLDFELAERGFKILNAPSTPINGIRVAMIEYNAAPIELMEFGLNYSESTVSRK